jgi:hypothetical protein
MFGFFRSRSAKVLLAVVGLSMLYAVGVIVRQHSGVRVIISNESNEPVRELSVAVESQGDGHNLQDLAPGDHERVFVKTVGNSGIVLEFAEGGQQSRTVTVFDHPTPGDCGTSTVRLLPRRSTESVEVHRSVSWSGWLDFL